MQHDSCRDIDIDALGGAQLWYVNMEVAGLPLGLGQAPAFVANHEGGGPTKGVMLDRQSVLGDFDAADGRILFPQIVDGVGQREEMPLASPRRGAARTTDVEGAFATMMIWKHQTRSRSAEGIRSWRAAP